MTLQATKVTAVRDGNAATAVTITSIAANTLLALFCHADSDDGSATESLSISSAGGLTWTKNVQSNGSPGAVVAIFTAPCVAGSSSITVSVADSQGNKDKSVLPVKFTDDNGGIPGTGNTSVAKPTTFSSSGAGSWAWGVGLGSDAGTPVETGQTAQDFVSGNSFNDGDNIVTFSLDAKSTASGQTMSLTFPSPLHDAAIEITAGTGGGGTTQNATASSTVTATGAAAAEADHNATATSSITSTGTAAATATHIASASSTVTATSAAAAAADHNASASAAITGTGTAAAEVDHNASASSSVTAAGSAAAEADHNASASQTVTAAGLAAVEVDRPTTAASTVTATLAAAATVTSPGGVNGDLAVTATLAAAASVTRSINASLSLLATLASAASKTTSVSGSLGVSVTASATASKPGIVIAGRLGIATTGARVQPATVGGIRSATSSGRLNSGSQ